MLSNPNGEATMPLGMAADKPRRLSLGLARLFTSDPMPEPYDLF